MNTPRLNRLLVLETRERVADGGGGYAESWTELGRHWAEVTARTGRERGEAGLPLSAVSYRITVRAAPHGTSARPVAHQRFREGVRVFLIQAVAERGADGRYLTCFADEEVVT